jgi:hypothetical protein
MKYCFTTLAIGDSYEELGISLFSELKNRTEFADFSITTTNHNLQLEESNNFIKWDIMDESPLYARTLNTFNYNLKSLSLKPFIKCNEIETEPYEFVVYVDADWLVNDKFEESKFLSLFEYMNENDVDMIYERPGLVRDHKKDPNSFVKHKLDYYGAHDHTKWDEANVVNEQFAVYRNNWKFRYYVRRWEQFLWYSIRNDIGNFGEGLEMGICALESEMNIEPVNNVWDIINEVFYFYNSSGVKFVRY